MSGSLHGIAVDGGGVFDDESSVVRFTFNGEGHFVAGDRALEVIAPSAGAYRATLSNGKTIQTDVVENEIPDALTLGPNWFLKAVGKDKNGKEYTREVHMPDLKNWPLIPELRYFSGKGHYTLDFQVDGRYLKPGLVLDMDLGEVHDVAEVWINGRKASTLLSLPYRLDATPFLEAGKNHLEIIVANHLARGLDGGRESGPASSPSCQRCQP